MTTTTTPNQHHDKRRKNDNDNDNFCQILATSSSSNTNSNTNTNTNTNSNSSYTTQVWDYMNNVIDNTYSTISNNIYTPTFDFPSFYDTSSMSDTLSIPFPSSYYTSLTIDNISSLLYPSWLMMGRNDTSSMSGKLTDDTTNNTTTIRKSPLQRFADKKIQNQNKSRSSSSSSSRQNSNSNSNTNTNTSSNNNFISLMMTTLQNNTSRLVHSTYNNHHTNRMIRGHYHDGVQYSPSTSIANVRDFALMTITLSQQQNQNQSHNQSQSQQHNQQTDDNQETTTKSTNSQQEDHSAPTTTTAPSSAFTSTATPPKVTTPIKVPTTTSTSTSTSTPYRSAAAYTPHGRKIVSPSDFEEDWTETESSIMDPINKITSTSTPSFDIFRRQQQQQQQQSSTTPNSIYDNDNENEAYINRNDTFIKKGQYPETSNINEPPSNDIEHNQEGYTSTATYLDSTTKDNTNNNNDDDYYYSSTETASQLAEGTIRALRDLALDEAVELQTSLRYWTERYDRPFVSWLQAGPYVWFSKDGYIHQEIGRKVALIQAVLARRCASIGQLQQQLLKAGWAKGVAQWGVLGQGGQWTPTVAFVDVNKCHRVNQNDEDDVDGINDDEDDDDVHNNQHPTTMNEDHLDSTTNLDNVIGTTSMESTNESDLDLYSNKPTIVPRSSPKPVRFVKGDTTKDMTSPAFPPLQRNQRRQISDMSYDELPISSIDEYHMKQREVMDKYHHNHNNIQNKSVDLEFSDTAIPPIPESSFRRQPHQRQRVTSNTIGGGGGGFVSVKQRHDGGIYIDDPEFVAVWTIQSIALVRKHLYRAGNGQVEIPCSSNWIINTTTNNASNSNNNNDEKYGQLIVNAPQPIPPGTSTRTTATAAVDILNGLPKWAQPTPTISSRTTTIDNTGVKNLRRESLSRVDENDNKELPSMTESTVPQTAAAAAISSSSTPISITDLPCFANEVDQILYVMEDVMMLQRQRRLEKVRPPSWIRSNWYIIASIVPVVVYTIQQIVFSTHTNHSFLISKQFLYQLLDGIKAFYHEHLRDPLLAIATELLKGRENFSDKKARTDAINSLKLMIKGWLDDTYPDMTPEARTQLAESMDMELIEQKKVENLRSPFYEMNNVVRMSFIEMQYMKKEMMNALYAMDEMMSSNDINMNLAAVTPTFVLVYGISRMVQYCTYALLKLKKSREETYASFRDILTDIERLLVMRDNPPQVYISRDIIVQDESSNNFYSSSDMFMNSNRPQRQQQQQYPYQQQYQPPPCVLGADDLGMLMLLVHECRSIMWKNRRRFSEDIIRSVSEDLAELAGERGAVSVQQQLRIIERMCRSYSFLKVISTGHLFHYNRLRNVDF